MGLQDTYQQIRLVKTVILIPFMGLHDPYEAHNGQNMDFEANVMIYNEKWLKVQLAGCQMKRKPQLAGYKIF